MRHRLVRTLCGTAFALASTCAFAYYEAPWSSCNFFQDQTWSQINNRLTDQRMADMRKSAGLGPGAKKRSSSATSERPAASASGKRASGGNRSLLALGEQASTDLKPLRPYLATTKLSEAQAAQVLSMYNDVATRLGVPYNDSASGIAAFLAGSYAAYTNKPFPDAYFKPLYEQFADSMSTGDSLKKTPLAERTEYYQRMVVAGMLYQLHQPDLQAKPDAAQITAMREAAASAFQQIAGRSPEEIRFTASGLQAR